MAEGNVCQLGASVPTGLELSAREECQEVLGRPINYSRGKLIFPLHSTEELIKVNKFFLSLIILQLLTFSNVICSSGAGTSVCGQCVGGGDGGTSLL